MKTKIKNKLGILVQKGQKLIQSGDVNCHHTFANRTLTHFKNILSIMTAKEPLAAIGHKACKTDAPERLKSMTFFKISQNSKRTRLSQYIASLLFMFSASSWAGGDSAGGGGAWQCPIDNQGNSNYELLEFWEARTPGIEPFASTLNRLVEIPERPETTQAQVKRAIDRIRLINEPLGLEVLKAYRHVTNSQMFIRPNLPIAPPTDTLQAYLKTDTFGNPCKLVGVGSYFDGYPNKFYHEDKMERLSYDEKILQNMSNTQAAGFWGHESIYYVLRNFADTNSSVAARLLNVIAFSDMKLPDLSEKPKDAKISFHCQRKQKTIGFWDYKGESFSSMVGDLDFYLHASNEEIIVVPKHAALDNRPVAESARFSQVTKFYMFERVETRVRNPDAAYGLVHYSEGRSVTLPSINLDLGVYSKFHEMAYTLLLRTITGPAFTSSFDVSRNKNIISFKVPSGSVISSKDFKTLMLDDLFESDDYKSNPDVSVTCESY